MRMPHFTKILWTLFLGLTACAATTQFQSPSGNLKLQLVNEEGLTYVLSGYGVTSLVKGKLGLAFADQKWPEDCAVGNVKEEKIDQSWDLPVGIQKTYRDHCNEYTVELKGDFPKRAVALRFRLYDEGVALRYIIKDETGNEYTLTQDLTDYLFDKDYECWYAPYGFGSSQEHESIKATVATIPHGTIAGCPLVVKSSNFALALTETDLRDWAGLYFTNGDSYLKNLGTKTGKDEAAAFTVDVTGKKFITLYHGAQSDISLAHADWVDLYLVTTNGQKVAVKENFIAEEKHGWGEFGINKSVDGNALKIGSKTFKNGFGSHAKGFIKLRLDGKYKEISGLCGVDAETGGGGLVHFAIYEPNKKATKPYLFATLAPRLDGKGLVVTKGERTSPWRLILIGKNELELVTNQMILNCAAPNAIGDASWIKPGRSTWNWWSDWNRNLCTASIKKEIDFAAAHKWEYSTVDDPWYSPHMGRVGNNVMKGQEGKVDLEEIAAYAKSKGVKLILWMHWADIDRMMDEAFAYYEKLGIGGMKIDFMNRDDQEMVKWYETTCQKAAKHHLIVNFHGSYKPSGFARTYPNQITSEGVLGNEASKWSHTVNPKNLASYPYTRYIQGPADLTPGGFLNRQPEAFKPATPTQVQGTRAHELALCFVLPTPLLCLCDNPINYEGQKGLEFLDQLKTTWDETLPLQGKIGEFYICARRSGDTWFLGMIGDDLPQTHQVPLNFLKEGKEYTAQIFCDNAESKIDATQIDILNQDVNQKTTLEIKTVRNGGFVAIIKPKK